MVIKMATMRAYVIQNQNRIQMNIQIYINMNEQINNQLNKQINKIFHIYEEV